jgi:DNA replication protein DnaC
MRLRGMADTFREHEDHEVQSLSSQERLGVFIDPQWTRKPLHKTVKINVLVVDDWAMAPLADYERSDFLEICDDRYQVRAALRTSQLPVPGWDAQIRDPTIADRILHRLAYSAHRIELRGESIRKGARIQKCGKEEQ